MLQSAIPTSETAISSLMKNYVNYNLWANITLVNWLRTKERSLLEREVPSSFPGIKNTLVHIWQTERYWLSMLKRTSPETYDSFNGSLEDLFTALLEKSAELAEYVNALQDEGISQNTLIVSPWFQSDFANFEYIMHTVTHTTYHRGQVITIGRNLGFTDAPMTDYNFYNVMKTMES